jgi:hypothetical protein
MITHIMKLTKFILIIIGLTVINHDKYLNIGLVVMKLKPNKCPTLEGRDMLYTTPSNQNMI